MGVSKNLGRQLQVFCVFENSSKIQSSHGKVEEKKIIPTIPIDMIGIKGYDKRNTKEAGQ